MFRVDAKAWACGASSSTRACRPGTVAKAATPQRKTKGTTANGCGAACDKATSMPASASRIPNRERTGQRSDSQPPATLPSVRPTPKTSSVALTCAVENPAAWCSRGATKVSAAKMPPKPVAVSSSAARNRGRARMRQSCEPVPDAARCRGTSRQTQASATSPSTLTTQNVLRQPACAPIQAPPGTPSTLASVRPLNISAMAAARRSGGTRPAATVEPTPKNAPWVRDATILPAISVG